MHSVRRHLLHFSSCRIDFQTAGPIHRDFYPLILLIFPNSLYLLPSLSPQSHIEKAKALNPKQPDIQFLVADATAFGTSPKLRGLFDVIVIRHQAIGGDIALWSKIFKESLKHLAEGGIMLITSYSCVEHQIALACLKALGAKIKLSGQNPFARRMIHGENAGIKSFQFRDHYVAIVTK